MAAFGDVSGAYFFYVSLACQPHAQIFCLYQSQIEAFAEMTLRINIFFNN
jgi:hypothetical protein